MHKLYGFIFIFIPLFMLSSCQSKPLEEVENVIENCDYVYQLVEGGHIKVISIESTYSNINGNLNLLVSPCVSQNQSVSFGSSLLKTHQIFISFDAVYPIDSLEIEFISDHSFIYDVSTSLDSKKYKKKLDASSHQTIHSLENIHARNIKLTIPAESSFQINRISILMGSGFRISLDEEFNQSIIQKAGWTGADGIFSFNLNGNDQLSAIDPNTLFIFSDTFIGDINPANFRRISPRLINNSFAYYNQSNEQLWEFVVSDEKAVFLPDAYINHHPYQLLSPEGPVWPTS